jgi:deoxyribodipyrimidine photo-lyase
MNVLLWFKRDLRLHDHPALTRAAALGAVLPVYVIEPELWRRDDASARQWDHLAEALADLRAALAARGATLAVRMGDAVEVLADLCRAHRIDRILSHEETGNLWTYARDRAVAAWARDAGIVWEELPQSGVVRRLQGRDGWAARRDAFMAAPVLPVPAFTPVPCPAGPALPDAADLGLATDPCPGRQGGGRAAGLALMSSFLAERGADYRRAMSAPDSGAASCSRLSPFIATGAVSLREVVQATARRQAARPPGPWGGSLRSFQSRLAWRDHFIQKLEDEPEIERRDLHPLAVPRPRDSDPVRLHAWAEGETGLPFLDACLRSLRATGWLNFRMRAMVVSVASYHLWLDWRASGAVLARRFTDYEPGIHWPQVQMQSGTTGINTPRIYNPVKQGHDQDPTGAFTRAWVPELAEVPAAFLQEPWRWDGADGVLGRRYPRPLIDVAEAGRAAREAIWGARRGAGFRAIADGIVTRHASRADPRFVNDRAPKRKTGQPAQGTFDF